MHMSGKTVKNRKHFPCFHTVIGTRVEVQEIAVGTRACRVHECFHAVSSSPKLSPVFLYRM